MINFLCKYSSPLKIIISGEHSVVYNFNALAASINERYFCEINQYDSNSDICQLSFIFGKEEKIMKLLQIFLQDRFQKFPISCFEDWKLEFEKEFILDKNNKLEIFYIISTLFSYVFSFYFLNMMKIIDYLKNKNVKCIIKSNLENWRGIGSSASVLSCLTACFLNYFYFIRNLLFGTKINLEIKEFQKVVNDKVFLFEQIYHSNPSGIDNTIINFGGILKYNKKTNIEFLNPDFLKLHFSIILINTKIEKNTKASVEMIKKMIINKETKEITEFYLEQIGNVSNDILNLFSNNENNNTLEKIEEFEKLIIKNQELLSSLNLSHSKIDLLVNFSKKVNIATKITGSGQGGCCISFIRKTNTLIKEYEKFLMENDFDFIETDFSNEGLKNEYFIEN